MVLVLSSLLLLLFLELSGVNPLAKQEHPLDHRASGVCLYSQYSNLGMTQGTRTKYSNLYSMAIYRAIRFYHETPQTRVIKIFMPNPKGPKDPIIRYSVLG